MKKIRKYLNTEGYQIVRKKRHLVFRNHLIQKSITVSSTPMCETQELKIVQQIVRKNKRHSLTL